jgi:MFS family permease
MVLTGLVLPAVSEGRTQRFDLTGWVLLAAAIVAVSVALSEGGPWGWTSPGVVGLLAASVVVGVLWATQQLRSDAPLVQLRQIRHRAVLTADVAGFFGCAAMYMYLPIMVEFVQAPPSVGYGFGASILVSGCLFLPLSATSFLSSRCMGIFERHFGQRAMVPFGLLLFGVASAFFGVEHRALWEAFVSSAVCGVGLGFSFAAMPGYIVRAVPPSETGAATGFYTVLRAVGLSVGSAVAAAVLSATTAHGELFPRVTGFEVALIAGGAVMAATAVFAYVAPGRQASPALAARRSGAGAAPGRTPAAPEPRPARQPA